MTRCWRYCIRRPRRMPGSWNGPAARRCSSAPAAWSAPIPGSPMSAPRRCRNASRSPAGSPTASRSRVIMDGDTGHGGIMAVRRMVKECIRRGIAGVRIDDQPIEGKRKTQDAGVEVVPLDLAIARYRAAVDMKNELDPDFVVMAQCYARDAANGGLEDALA